MGSAEAGLGGIGPGYCRRVGATGMGKRQEREEHTGMHKEQVSSVTGLESERA